MTRNTLQISMLPFCPTTLWKCLLPQCRSVSLVWHTLRTIADGLDMVDLEKTEGITSAHLKHYGGKILGATVKHLREQEKANGITPGGLHSRFPFTGRARASAPATTAPASAPSGTASTSQARKRLTLPPSGTGSSSSVSKSVTAKRTSPLEQNKVLANLQSFAYKPNLGQTLPITAYATGSGLGENHRPASVTATGEKRITLNTLSKPGAARPRF